MVNAVELRFSIHLNDKVFRVALDDREWSIVGLL